MTPHGDPDSQATSKRAVRRKNKRPRQAARILARTAWLDGHLVFWSGSSEEVSRFTGGVLPLRAVLQERLAALPVGLYAVRIGFPASVALDIDHRKQAPAADPPAGNLPATARGPLRLEITAIDAVTRERVAETARAIEAAAKFPRAAARFVGPVPGWSREARARLDRHRRAVEGASALAVGEPGALALEACAFWLGAGLPPSMTLSESALHSWTANLPDLDPAASRLAAVAFGRRHLLPACHPRLAAWAAAGRALDRWPAVAVAWAATALDPERLTALVAAAPRLNDTRAVAWAEERGMDPTPVTAEELASLARLLAVVDAVRAEPARRHDLLCRLALQYLQLWRSCAPGRYPEASQEVEGAFRHLVLDVVYGGVRDLVSAGRYRVPNSMPDLADRWVGEALPGQRTFAYVDALMSGAALTLGHDGWISACDNPPTGLSLGVPAGSALDPDGAAAVVTGANRLRWKGAANALDAMAVWLETCRPVVPLGRFWPDVLTVVPSSAPGFDADRAQRLVASLTTHGRRVATELALDQDDQVATARALLPAVLARGPEATERVFCRDLWMDDEQALDAALCWTDAAERLPRARDPHQPIPVPRRALAVADPAVREALVAIGLRAWGEGGVRARDVEFLLGVLANAGARSDGVYWRAALPALVDVAAHLASRVLGAAGHTDGVACDRADLVHVILDVCARWHGEGFGDSERLARILANRWSSAEQAAGEWDLEQGDHGHLRVRLSEGRIARFLALLRQPPPARQYAWRAADGWALAAAHPIARAWLSPCLDRTELVSRVVHLLERLALVARLDPGLTAARFFKPLVDDAPDTLPALPGWVEPETRVRLEQVARAGALAGAPAAIPGALQRILDRGATTERERVALRGRASGRTLSQAERARLNTLARLAADPAARDAGLRAELGKALPKHLALAGLAALEALVRRDLDLRWQRVLGSGRGSLDGPAWDNALHMLRTVTCNRRVLLRLLRRSARGDRAWMHEVTPNRAFLDHLASTGLRPAEWLGDRALVVAGHAGPIRAYATTDPLEVLQMGSLFGTCLSAGKFNAHAAVAAAVEVNKRVLYVKDGAGRVLGRQLVALTRGGELIGFTCYGAGSDDPVRHGPWVKLALELLALDLARASGARLMAGTRIASGLDEADERSLSLFCRGYVDSPEAFDWWVEALAAADSRSGEGDRALLRSLLVRPVPADMDARACPGWKREELGWAACRALLWLRADAPPLTAEHEEALGIGPSQRALHEQLVSCEART